MRRSHFKLTKTNNRGVYNSAYTRINNEPDILRLIAASPLRGSHNPAIRYFFWCSTKFNQVYPVSTPPSLFFDVAAIRNLRGRYSCGHSPIQRYETRLPRQCTHHDCGKKPFFRCGRLKEGEILRTARQGRDGKDNRKVWPQRLDQGPVVLQGR